MDIVTLAAAKSYSKTYTDSAISGIGGGITYKGAVNYYSSLPSNASVGDAYTVKYKGSSGTYPDGSEYVWGSYEGTNQWIKLGSDSEVLTVVYTNTNGTITCNQEWETIKDAIDSNRPIQGYYEDLTDVPSKVYSIQSFLYLPMSTSSSILCDCGLISADSSGYITIKKIFDGLQSNVRTTYITSVPYRVLPSVSSSDNNKVLGVVSGNWNKTTLGTIMSPNAQLEGTEPELKSLTIDGVKYKIASESTIYTNLLTMQYGTPANNGGV